VHIVKVTLGIIYVHHDLLIQIALLLVIIHLEARIAISQIPVVMQR
jgi:hypothetical protein